MNEYPWMEIARSKLGDKEIPGPPANPDIVEFLYSTTLDGPDCERDETPWCSAFVNWCIEQAGFQGTNSAWARSWQSWGQEADWDNLIPGAVVVLQRGAKSGHVGFFVDSDGENIKLLGEIRETGFARHGFRSRGSWESGYRYEKGMVLATLHQPR